MHREDRRQGVWGKTWRPREKTHHEHFEETQTVNSGNNTQPFQLLRWYSLTPGPETAAGTRAAGGWCGRPPPPGVQLKTLTPRAQVEGGGQTCWDPRDDSARVPWSSLRAMTPDVEPKEPATRKHQWTQTKTPQQMLLSLAKGQKRSLPQGGKRQSNPTRARPHRPPSTDEREAGTPLPSHPARQHQREHTGGWTSTPTCITAARRPFRLRWGIGGGPVELGPAPTPPHPTPQCPRSRGGAAEACGGAPLP